MPRGDSHSCRCPSRRPRTGPSRRRVLAGIGAGLSFPFRAMADASPLIAAAASWRPPLEQIVRLYEAASGQRVRVSYGATGNLVRQIEAGAPFEVLLAADEASVNRLEAAGLTDGPGRILARGEIVVAVAKSSPLALDGELAGLRVAATAGRIRRLAFANPDLAPYGRAAREVMEKAGLWALLQSRLALAENIAQAAQFVASGAADVGLIAKSSAVSDELRDVLRWAAVRDDWYQPIDQRMAVLKSASAGGRAFAAFFGGSEARVVLERSGFRIP